MKSISHLLFFFNRTLLKKKNTENNKCRRERREIGSPIHCWWKHEIIQSLWKTVWQFPLKSTIELPYDPAAALLDTPEELKQALRQMLYMHGNNPNVH